MSVAQSSEPSVEEILNSIKKVIARDNRDDANELRHPPSNLEESSCEPAVPEPADAEEAAEVLELGEAELVGPEEQTSESALCASKPLDGLDEDTPLTTEAQRALIRENLAALATLAAPGAQPQIVRQGETSLEGLTRELLRPMLAAWLEENLPSMVERLVQAEIARIAGKKG